MREAPCHAGSKRQWYFFSSEPLSLSRPKPKIEIFQALETIMESCPRHNASLGITQIYCFYFPLGGIQSHHQTFISSGFHTLGLDLHHRAAKIVLTMPSIVDTLVINFPRNIIPQAYVLRMVIQVVIQRYSPPPISLKCFTISFPSIGKEAQKKNGMRYLPPAEISESQ